MIFNTLTLLLVGFCRIRNSFLKMLKSNSLLRHRSSKGPMTSTYTPDSPRCSGTADVEKAIQGLNPVALHEVRRSMPCVENSSRRGGGDAVTDDASSVAAKELKAKKLRQSAPPETGKAPSRPCSKTICSCRRKSR